MKKFFKSLLCICSTFIFSISFSSLAYAATVKPNSAAPQVTNLQIEYISTDTLVSQGWLQFYDISTGSNATTSDYPLTGSTLKLAVFTYGYGGAPYISVNGVDVTKDRLPDYDYHSQYWTDATNMIIAFRDFYTLPLSDLTTGYNTITITSISNNYPYTRQTDTVTVYKADTSTTTSKAIASNDLIKNLTDPDLTGLASTN